MIGRTSLVGTGIALLLAAAPVFQQAGAQTPEPENIVLGRPTADSITVHALADEATAVFVEYGEQPDTYSSRSPVVEANTDDVAEITVGGLRPNTRYFYRVNYRGASDSGYRAGSPRHLHPCSATYRMALSICRFERLTLPHRTGRYGTIRSSRRSYVQIR